MRDLPLQGIVDTETHLFERAWPIEGYPDAPRYEHYHWHEHDSDLLVSEMDRAGVALALVISYDGYDFKSFMERQGATPSDFYGGEAYTRGCIERHPDRLLWFPTLQDPRDSKNVTRLEGQLDGGAAGVKFFPAYLDLPFGAAEMRPVLDLLEEAGSRLMVGMEDSPDPAERLGDATKVLEARPGLPVQLNHGACVRFDCAEDLDALGTLIAQTAQVYVSTSVLGGPLMEWTDGCEYPFRGWLSKVERLVEVAGPDRVVWATDWPWFEQFGKYPQFVDAVRIHADFLDDEARADFLGGNALRYLRSTPSHERNSSA